MPSSSFARLSAVAVAIAATTSACRVDASVGIDAEADGTGRVRATVELDRAAYRELQDAGTKIRSADLTAAGWRVQGPTATDDGGAVIVATHDFDSPEEVDELVDELGGAPDGPFRDVRLRVDRSFAKTTSEFSATVDLQRGVDAFTDERMRAALRGDALGLGAEALQERLGAALDRVFGLRIAVRLPGETESNAPGDVAAWSPKLGERVTLEARAERWNVLPLALSALGLLAAAGAIGVFALTRYRK